MPHSTAPEVNGRLILWWRNPKSGVAHLELADLKTDCGLHLGMEWTHTRSNRKLCRTCKRMLKLHRERSH